MRKLAIILCFAAVGCATAPKAPKVREAVTCDDRANPNCANTNKPVVVK